MGSATDLTSVIRHLGPSEDLSGDRDLLTRYATRRDAAAFGALVQRYGALVLGVARRHLGDRHRAEDVFQATFLALARSAHRLGGRTGLANWLYVVALRQARKTLARTARCETLERASVPPQRPDADPLAEITARELVRAIDDELTRLPDRFRLPVLLCCVQGLSREEAAQRLGWAPGAVKGRLERGRQKLATRLVARGLAPSAIVLAPLAALTVPADLVARTVQLAEAPWARTVPAPVAALAANNSRLTTLALAAGIVAAAIGAFVLVTERPEEPHTANTLRTSAGPAAPTQPAPGPDDPLPDGATVRFGTSRFRHPTIINSLVVVADGTFAVANGEKFVGHALRAYDLTTGRARFTLEGDRGDRYFEAVAVAPDGKTLASKQTGFLRLHDAATGRETARINYVSPPPGTDGLTFRFTTTNLLEFSPEGTLVLVAGADGKELQLIDPTKGPGELTVRKFPHTQSVHAAAFSRDGKYLVGGGEENEKGSYFARLWDPQTGKELHRLPFGAGEIRCVAFAPDGANVAVGGDGWNDNGKLAVRLFDTSTGKERLKIVFPDAVCVRSLAFSPNGKILAASGGAPPRQVDVRTGSSTRLFDAATGKEVLNINGTGLGLQFAPDGASLVGAVAGAIYRWDAVTGRVLTPEGADSSVNQIEVTPDGARLVTRTLEGETQVWDTRTGALVRSVDREGGWGRGLALGPDGRYLAWSAPDRSVRFADPERPQRTLMGSRVRVFDLKAGAPVERFEGFAGGAHSSAFTPDGKTLVTVDHQDGTVRLWAFETGKLGRSFRIGEKGERSSVSRARLSPDGKVLAAVHAQEQRRGEPWRHVVRLWDTATGKELLALPEYPGRIETLSFSPDGKYLVTGEPPSPFIRERLKKPEGEQAFVWEVATGKRVTSLPVEVTATAFASDGKTLAVAGAGGAIQLWDTSTWALQSTFPVRGSLITALTFGPDGRLFSGSADATILAWNTKAAKLPPAEPK